MSDPQSAPTVDDNHSPETYGGGALGGFMSIMGPRIKAKQQEELNQRAMERDHFWKQMNDPALSVQPGDDDATRTRKQQQLAWLQAEYGKRSGTESKGMLQKALPFLQHLRGHKVEGQDSGAGGGESLGMPAPPQGAAPTDAVPPPPTSQAAAPATAAIPPPPSGADVASTIAEGTFSRGLAHDKAATQQGNTLALEQSKATQLQAAEVASQALDKLFPNLPASQKQTMLARKLGFVPPVKMVTKTVADTESATGASNVSYDAITGEVYTTQTGAFLPRGYIPTETITRDPYGNQTVSVRTPMAPGVGTSSGGAKPPASKAAPTAPTASSSGGGGGRAPAIPPPLDADGHISGTPQGYTPQAIEGANRLLDGEDVNKLPAQSRAVSGKLARQYGWEQGKFTPKEQTQLREAITYLQQMAESPALEALDGGFTNRTQLSVVLSAPDEKGAVSSMLANASAMHLDDKQAEFVQLYNQIVQTIGGLRQLAGGGKQTEAAIQRLLSELPNPTTTRDSKDARQRLHRILSEVTVAMKKGSFSAAEVTSQKKQAYQKDGKYYDATTHQEIK